MSLEPIRTKVPTSIKSYFPFQTLSTIIFNRFAGLVLASILLATLVFPRVQEHVPRSLWTLLGCAVGIGIIILVKNLPAKSPGRPSPNGVWLLAVVGAMCAGSVAVVVGRALSFDYGWDARVVMEAAQTLAVGSDLGAYPYDYFSRYPNNIPLLALDRLIVSGASLFGIPLGTAIAFLNGVCVTVVSISVFISVKTLSSTRFAFLSQGMVFAFFAFSPWLAVPYTDLPVAALLALSVALWLVTFSESKSGVTTLAVCAMSGIAAGAAIALKPTAMILLIAMSLSVLSGTRRGRWRRATTRLGTALGAACIVIILSSSLLPAAAGLDTAKLDASRAFPMHHFARMGLIEAPGENGATRYGGYDAAAVKEMGAAETVAERKALSLAAMESELRAMGPVGYPSFLGKKAIWIWSDGTFGSWVEGRDHGERLGRDGALSTALQSFLHPAGASWPLWSASLTGLWFALLLTISFFLWPQGRRTDVLVLSLSVLGIGAFSLLFEGRARYLIIFLPAIITLASCLPAYPGAWRALQHRRNPARAKDTHE
ncbi:glycosyltransferase family 39 protein [Leucobacter komagatae]|nr:glycosyltransferase family 39 protein [Leucobacter komagatae]